MKKQSHTASNISSGADERLKPEVKELAEQVFFLKRKLAALRVELKDAPAVVEYQNGPDQIGTHPNPALKVYGDLLTLYNKSLTTLSGMIGEANKATVSCLTDLRKAFKVGS